MWKKSKLSAVALALALAVPAVGLAEAHEAQRRADVERIVREYLLANPEIIAEAIGVLRERRKAEQRARAAAAIAENEEALNAHPLSPVSGDPDGDVTVVEFFDYRCGFCKRALPVMTDLLETDPKVRVVWKEFPILGPVSDFAARASMAADRQGRFLQFHKAVMGAPGKLTEAKVLEIAGRNGLDIERLRRDMKDPAIEAYIRETRKLAEEIGVTGTPAFVIGGTFVGGVIDSARMKELVAAARAGD